jgi:hypothetical protein
MVWASGPFENRQKCPVFIMIIRISNRSKTGQIGPVFAYRSKTEPFDNRMQIEHLNTGFIRFSDAACKQVSLSVSLCRNKSPWAT